MDTPAEAATSRHPAADPPRRQLGNVPLTPVSMPYAVDLISQWAGQTPFRLVVTPNVDHIMILQHNPAFAAAYDHAALSLADGAPVLWAARYLGLGNIEKVSGSDLVPELCRHGGALGWKIFFAGGQSQPDLDQGLRAIADRYPGLQFAGHFPPFGFDNNPAQSEQLLAAIASFNPHLLFIACGAPKSEIWLHRHRDRLARGVGIGIGAGLNFLSGRERRAPRWMQRNGLEWLWRMARDPRRLAKRYLIDDIKFFPLVWKWKRASKR